MITLNQNRERIKNGTVLHLTSGITVTSVNDRGYQISVTDPTNKRNLNFIQPSEIQSIAPLKETNAINSSSSNSVKSESTITNDSIASINDLSDS